MKDVFYIFITLVLAIVAYFTSLNIYIPIFVLLSFLLYYLLIGRKLLNKREQIVRRIHACYHFINAFIISMSVKESLEDAYQSGVRYEDKELNEVTAQLENLKVSDRISYLREFFNLAVFKMFMQLRKCGRRHRRRTPLRCQRCRHQGGPGALPTHQQPLASH